MRSVAPSTALHVLEQLLHHAIHVRVCIFSGRAELWDVPEVREFFNLDSMENGKSYAERAHSLATGGSRSVII